MEVFLVYLWLKLDHLHIALSIGVAIALMTQVAWGIGLMTSYETDDLTDLHRFGKRGLLGVIVTGALLLLTPTSSQVAILVGAHYAVKLADTPEAEKVMTLVRMKANEMLDEQIKETK